MKHDNTAIAPWYKQPWLWFILAPVIASVFSGSTFLYLSIVSADGIVKDDYYKVAKGLEIDDRPALQAAALNLSAELLLDDITGDIGLTLHGKVADDLNRLTLEIVHPIHQKYDQNIQLRRIPGSTRFTGSLQATLSVSKHFVVVVPPDNSWNLRTEVEPPYDPLRIQLSSAR
ncbi:FixH family protein [Marinobacterium sedimentorum]|uniref:FixH family protein n=1 Tax=Marinobacterium sedimentorum TaxID=2927804 RepID=UPI0020C5FB68|nr:FixH family protein [Marinobacterium sedimentorum]MCP8689297.1 FixH family protein [Marinobacterium sedimentorum]